MKKIAHRGNISGPKPELENTVDYILKAISEGYDVEVDVWAINNTIFLGHDTPAYRIDESFLEEHKNVLWIHCKSLETLYYFALMGQKYNVFWHESDRYTLTSKGYIWTYPGNLVTAGSVIVDLSEFPQYNGVYGICGDYVANIREES